MEFDFGNLLCLDVDECNQNACGIGFESCANTEGSYTCTCGAEYVAMPTKSGETCIGITSEC